MEAANQLKITVDHNKCVGSTICVLLVPKVFALNGDGQSTVANASGDSLQALLNAAENCPLSAIGVVDQRTGKVLFPPEDED